MAAPTFAISTPVTQMFGERPDHTLQANALVHKVDLRLVDAQQIQRWECRGHFFSAAAEAMRRT